MAIGDKLVNLDGLKVVNDEVADLKSALEYGSRTIDLLTNATLHSGYKIANDGTLEEVSTYNVYEIACDGSFDTFSAEIYSNSNYNMKAVSFVNAGGTVLSTLAYPSTSGASEFTDQTIPEGAAKIYISNKTSFGTPSASAQVAGSKRLADIEEELSEIQQIPSGGTTGQVLTKVSGADYDVEWGDSSSETDSQLSLVSENPVQNKVIAKEVNRIKTELNYQNMDENLLINATKYSGYKIDENGEKASSSNNDVYEILYDGSYPSFSATLYSNSTYNMYAISFQTSEGVVISKLAYTSTSDASTYTNQTIPAGTGKILLNNRRSMGDASAAASVAHSKRLVDIEEDIADNTADVGKIASALTLVTKNLFNPATAQTGLIGANNGTYYPNESEHIASDYIAVSPNTIYTISARATNTGLFSLIGCRYAFYTSAKAYISGEQSEYGQFRTPSNAAYVRFSLKKTVNDIQLERRSFASKYVPYNGYSIADESETMFLNFPRKVYAVPGLEYNWYTFNVTPERYRGQFAWTFKNNNTKMHNYGRFLRWENNNSSEVVTKVVVEAAAPTKRGNKVFDVVASDPTKLDNVSVLILGDSTTANGYVATDLHGYSGNENKITTLGTLGTAPYNHEGRSGWTLSDYFTKSTNNPFYNPSTQTFDAGYYFTQTQVDVPDLFIINLGINDMHYNSGDLYDAKNTADEFINNVNAVITSLRTVDANMKVAICLTIPPNVEPWGFGAAGTNIIDYDSYRIANLILCEKLIDTFDYREGEGLYLIPINASLDTQYNMPSSAQLPNSRASETVMLPDTAGNVHPNAGGYYQIADVIYAFLCATFKTN